MFAFCLASAIENNGLDKNSEIEMCIKNMAAGDKTDMAKLYELCKSAVFGYCLSILKNRQDSEDILQETFIRIFNASSCYKPNGNPMPWILTIAKNLCLMNIRDRKKFKETTDEEWENMSFSDVMLNNDDRFVLSDLLSVLNDEERQIILLHATAGLKHREIAQLLGIGLSTALSKYNRALKKIKKHYERSECYVSK